jgi:hypothetical protein
MSNSGAKRLTEQTDSKDSGYRLQEFIEFALNVTL